METAVSFAAETAVPSADQETPVRKITVLAAVINKVSTAAETLVQQKPEGSLKMHPHALISSSRRNTVSQYAKV